MPNRSELMERRRACSVQTELETAQHVGAVVLLAAAGGFLQLAFALDRVVDFSRFAY